MKAQRLSIRWLVRTTGLLLLCLASPMLRAESILICENQSVPQGYVVTQRAMPANDCGSWNSGQGRWTPYSKMRVTKLGDSEITVCDGAPQSKMPPDGYVITATGINGVRCGSWRSGQNRWTPYKGTKIKKL